MRVEAPDPLRARAAPLGARVAMMLTIASRPRKEADAGRRVTAVLLVLPAGVPFACLGTFACGPCPDPGPRTPARPLPQRARNAPTLPAPGEVEVASASAAGPGMPGVRGQVRDRRQGVGADSGANVFSRFRYPHTTTKRAPGRTRAVKCAPTPARFDRTAALATVASGHGMPVDAKSPRSLLC